MMPPPYHQSMLPLWLERMMLASAYRIKVRKSNVPRLTSLCCCTAGGLTSASIQSPSALFSFSHVRNATRMDDDRLGALRTASSRGVKATVAEQVGSRQANDPETEAGIAPHQRIGLGLPMSNIFATSVRVHSCVEVRPDTDIYQVFRWFSGAGVFGWMG